MHWTNEKTLIFRVSQHQGPSLIFGTLPKVFGALTGGPVFAVAFFVLILFAAVTSAIALLEVVVSYVVGRWGWPRRRAVLVMGFLIFLLGIPSSLSFGPLADFKIAGYNFFDFVGVLTDNILLQKFYEAGPYIALSEHDIATRMLVISNTKYNSLTDEQKAWVDEAAQIAGEKQWEYDVQLNEEAQVKIEANGGQIIEIEDRDRWVETATPLMEQAAENLGVTEIYNQIVELR